MAALGTHLVTGTTMFIARLKFVWRVYAVPGRVDALCGILDLPERAALSVDQLTVLEEARGSAMVVVPRDREREARLRAPAAACPENARQYQTRYWMATYPYGDRVIWSESLLAHDAVCIREFLDGRMTVVSAERAVELRELARAYPSFINETASMDEVEGV